MPDVIDASWPRPGKIIAVHAGYASRAAESGESSPSLSYFLKPSSSIAVSGGHAELPVGTDQLRAEGEVALVIGAPARAVRPEDAWAHVAWVTAANDLGAPQLYADDRGSLLRAKGRDGFTPLGPALLPAGDLDPRALRVRTWVNGEPVQDETTGGMLFGLEQIIADLSQHLTLDTGDVILTGTPAGSATVRSGDVVEVEVDIPGTPISSGRLRTSVGEADGAAAAPRSALTPELRAKLERAPVAGLSAQLRKRGLDNTTVDGVRSLVAGHRFVGTARTLRYLPNREDLFAAHGGGYNPQKRAFDAVEPGEVLVIEARGETGSATLGDILALRAHARGAAAIVTDGGVRDAEAVAAIGIAVFAASAHPAVLGRKHVAWDTGLTIACGGTTVQPGDILVGDADGIVVIPPALAEAVADDALAQEDEDAWIADQIRAGHPIQGLFPMNARWRSRYEQQRQQQPDGVEKVNR
ncbi:fumarylacetoacetate hydrolase family protein [Hamadaea sp. NPDC051192]|uniref:fumarylacetoacetate hydrolase family protein n=1 Tax=Hamadaea sp. NPDC051192 TaxID=3154940 RepID=UPI0034431F9B